MAFRRWPPAADQVIAAFIRWLDAERSASYEIVERPDMRERTLLSTTFSAIPTRAMLLSRRIVGRVAAIAW